MRFSKYIIQEKHTDFGKGEPKKYQDSPFTCVDCKRFSDSTCPRERAGHSNDSSSTICKDFKK